MEDVSAEETMQSLVWVQPPEGNLISPYKKKVLLEIIKVQRWWLAFLGYVVCNGHLVISVMKGRTESLSENKQKKPVTLTE